MCYSKNQFLLFSDHQKRRKISVNCQNNSQRQKRVKIKTNPEKIRQLFLKLFSISLIEIARKVKSVENKNITRRRKVKKNTKKVKGKRNTDKFSHNHFHIIQNKKYSKGKNVIHISLILPKTQSIIP